MSELMTTAVKNMEYRSLNGEIKRTMRRSAKDIVQVGFMLRRMMDEKLWLEEYSCFDDYLDKELHIDYSMANRFMGINKKYSLFGNSMEIAEKYKDYSQGLLIEMLNMTGEQEAKVTPDMTVKQAREIKKQDKKPKSKPAPDSIPVVPVPEKEAVVIDGEFREVKESEKVATSQSDQDGKREQEESLSPYGLSKTVYPEGSLLTTVGCGHKYDCFSCAQDCAIRQEVRYCVEAPMGNPFSCTTMDILGNIRSELGEQCQFINSGLAEHTAGSNEPVPCCKNCGNESCNFRCKRSIVFKEKAQPESPDSLPEDGIAVTRHILEQEKEKLADILKVNKVEKLPEMMVLRQKTIVGALAALVCDLEAADTVPEEPEQPEMPVLKNNDQRKNWLEDYKSWGLWYRDEHIGAEFYKYDFADGTRLIAETYPASYRASAFYHLVGGPKIRKATGKYGIPKYPHHDAYSRYPDSVTEIVEFLKIVQKEKTD